MRDGIKKPSVWMKCLRLNVRSISMSIFTVWTWIIQWARNIWVSEKMVMTSSPWIYMMTIWVMSVIARDTWGYIAVIVVKKRSYNSHIWKDILVLALMPHCTSSLVGSTLPHSQYLMNLGNMAFRFPMMHDSTLGLLCSIVKQFCLRVMRGQLVCVSREITK